MSQRGASRSSSVYSQGSGNGGQGTTTSLGAPVRTSSPDTFDPNSRAPSSRYSNATSAGSGSGYPPPRPPPSSGYSPARPPTSRSSSGNSGSPATPGHASLMSAYGHSSYAGSQPPPSNRSSSVSGSGSGGQAPPPSSTSYSKTFIDSAPQTSSARGPPTSPFPVSRAPPSQPSRDSSGVPPAYTGSFMATVASSNVGLLNDAGHLSRERRAQGSFMANVASSNLDLLNNAGRRSRERRAQGREESRER